MTPNVGAELDRREEERWRIGERRGREVAHRGEERKRGGA
jgi:hypothetical protein